MFAGQGPLLDLLVDRIDADGPISTAEYMEACLYHPDHGYYTAGPQRPGVEWTTAPTLHPIFAKTLARGLAPLLDQLETPHLVEAGAGSGELMRDTCLALADQAPELYERLTVTLVERSEPSRDRSLDALDAAGLGSLEVDARAEPPNQIEGVLLSNELLDAIPAHQAMLTDEGLVERCLAVDDGQLAWTARPFEDPQLSALAEDLIAVEAPGTILEVPQASLAWYEAATGDLVKGAVVTIDYGATAKAIQTAIPQGTFHGYLASQPTDQVLQVPGQMDLTFLVPFDHVARAGEAAGLTTAAYATQETMLESLGIRSFAPEMDAFDVMAAKKLISPEGAGGTFQWLVQTKGIELPQPWPKGCTEVLGPEDPPAPWLESSPGLL